MPGEGSDVFFTTSTIYILYVTLQAMNWYMGAKLSVRPPGYGGEMIDRCLTSM